MTDYNLILRTSVMQNLNFVRDLTLDAQMWQRTIRLQGGYWQGSFRIIAPMNELIDYFYNWLGYDLQETVGGIQTWNGLVYEMTLVTPSASRVRSYDSLYNYVQFPYTGGTAGPYFTQESLDRYGRRVYSEDLGDIGATPATTYAVHYLRMHNWPYVLPISGGVSDNLDQSAYLDIQVCGYVFTMNNRFTTTIDGSSAQIGAWISSIVSADCTDFILTGNITANTTSIKKSTDLLGLSGTPRCWELAAKLIDCGDASYNLYRGYVGNDRYFNYQLLDTTPLYYVVRGKLSQNLSSPELINPWTVKPGVFRDMDYPISNQEKSAWFSDARDCLVEEISVGADSGLSWQSLDMAEASQQALLDEIAAFTDNGGDVESGAKKTTNWKRKAGLKPGTKAWEEAAKMGRTAWTAAHPKKRG